MFAANADVLNAKQAARLAFVLASTIITRAVNYVMRYQSKSHDEAVETVVDDLLRPSATRLLYEKEDFGSLTARTFVTYYVLVYREIETAIAKVSDCARVPAVTSLYHRDNAHD